MGAVLLLGELLSSLPRGMVGLGALLAAVTAGVVGASVVNRRWSRAGITESSEVDGEQPVPLTDHDRITKLLQQGDGRMRQSAIVAETGWSKSKVSTVLSAMHDEGLVTKLRLGRENLICLPGCEPEAVRSPHDR